MIWELLLHIKDLVRSNREVKWLAVQWNALAFGIGINEAYPPENSIIIDLENEPRHNAAAIFKCNRPFCARQLCNDLLTDEQVKLLCLYLPYALLPYFARKNSRTYAITHFAQTLDGRIASQSLDSKWIGNQENLIHAHRMRALCDAILIGSKTLITDDPQLSVRHVKGKSPLKVIIGGDNLSLQQYKAVSNDTLIFSQNHQDSQAPVKTIRIAKTGGKYKTLSILKKLYEREIYSVYIEGGAITSSNFLCEKCVDQVQIHFSPKIIGSGTTGFNFKGAKTMNDAFAFKSHKFLAVGDGMMFIGET